MNRHQPLEIPPPYSVRLRHKPQSREARTLSGGQAPICRCGAKLSFFTWDGRAYERCATCRHEMAIPPIRP